jgi:chromosome segregation ATPase
MMRVILPLLALAQAASAVSPVEKVITMLEDLQTQCITEGKQEATTYDKFACFCKDMTDDKTEAIASGETNIDDLTATMNSKAAARDDDDVELGEKNDKIAEKHEEIDNLKEKRLKEQEQFQTDLQDFKDMLVELDAAKQAMVQGMKLEAKMAAATAGFALDQQQESVRRTLQRVALRLKDPAVVSATGEVGYEGHSGKLVDKVESMENQARIDKDQCIADEQKSQQEHDKQVLQLQLEIGTLERNVQRVEERKAKTSAQLASTQQDLTAALAKLHDDQSYLKDLTAKCEDKSNEYDQRSNMRAEELSAITQALTILGGTVSEKTSGKTVRLVQQKAVVITPSAPADEDEDAVDKEDEDEDVSFLQKGSEFSPRERLSALARSVKSASFMAAGTPRDRLVQLLKTKSTELKSTVLASLASKASADPFAKIKQLVDELINRLLQEAADEASHKGWCDKELTTAKQTRSYKADSVGELNTQLEWGEAKRDKLAQAIDKLETEIAELTDSLDKTTKQREAESEENASTVSEAEEGLAAIEKALDTLRTFYDKAKDAEVESLVQVAKKGPGEADDLPDTGFSGANKGSQSAAGGIIAMMEVIESDFQRTIKETKRIEKEADTDFLELERTTKTSITDKDEELSSSKEDKSATVTEIGDNLESLKEQQDLLDKALQELEELRPACIDTGMSYEERVARREQEVEALNEALCILDEGSATQTEPACGK